MTTLHAEAPTATALPPRRHHPPAGVGALCFGIAGAALVLPVVGPLLAVGLGRRALGQARRDPGRYRDVVARASVTLGWAGLATTPVAALVLLAAAGPG